jgi:hypothetical protein
MDAVEHRQLIINGILDSDREDEQMKSYSETAVNLSGVMTAWEQCILAKHYPGKYDTKFVAGMNQVTSDTGVLRAQQTLNSIAQFNLTTESIAAPGINTYTIILYCPAISAIYAPTLSGRASGVCIGQTSSLNVANFVRISDFTDVEGAYSMVDIWKSDGTGIF